MKNLQLKHINNNLFLLDLEQEIKDNDYYFLKSVSTRDIVLKASEEKISSNCHKIIAQLNSKLPNIPLFTLPVKPKVDVGKKSDDYCEGFAKEYHNELKIGYYAGYTEALSDNADKKFTKEDIELAVILARKTSEISLNDIVICCERTQPNLQEFDGKFVEIEMEKEFTGYNEHKLPFIPKLTNKKITITKIL